MKAITYSQPGDSSVLSLEDRPLPEPAAGEVRVRLTVSGVNPTDWKARATTGRPLPFDEVTPNQDGAGVVDAIGADVDTLSVGQRVWVYLAAHQRPFGTAAQYTVLPASRAVPLPDSASFELGASLGVPAMTAHRALTVHEDGPSRLAPGALAGRTVLVQGGAGAVGHAAIQLAAWAGATVIATVSSDEKEALARAAGAHHVLQYPSETLADGIRELAPNGVEHIVEVAIADNAGLDVEVVANHGTIGYYADNGGADFTAACARASRRTCAGRACCCTRWGSGRCSPPPKTSRPPSPTERCRSGRTPVSRSRGSCWTTLPRRTTPSSRVRWARC